jgi:rare lipoprotein A
MSEKARSRRGLWAAGLAGAVAIAAIAIVVLRSEPGQSPSAEPASPQANSAQDAFRQDSSRQDPAGQNKSLRKTGHASWYDFSGEETANGEITDEDDMTAAHRWLPFGTRVRVENLENGKDVTVRIKDRGPYAKDRIIDVSEEAAERLEMTEDGVVKVRIKKVTPPDAGATSSSTAQPD